MRDGYCPKCRSEEVYLGAGEGAQSCLSTGGGEPLLRIYREKRFLPDIWLLEMDCYVCRACGYFEMYVRDLAELSKLEDSTNWRRVKQLS